MYEWSHGPSRIFLTQSEFVKLSTSWAAVWGGGVPEERGGAAWGEGKETRNTLSHYLSSNKHTLSHAHIHIHALASAHPGCFPSTSSHSWPHRYYALSVVVRTRWVGFSAGFLAHCPQLQASISRSVCCLILTAIPFTVIFYNHSFNFLCYILKSISIFLPYLQSFSRLISFQRVPNNVDVWFKCEVVW